jgi:class 3 adenylate cyclase
MNERKAGESGLRPKALVKTDNSKHHTAMLVFLAEVGAMTETRKLAAILVADVSDYSRLTGDGQERTPARLRGLRSDLIDPDDADYRGRVLKRTGDGSVIEFRSVVDAVRRTIELQTGLIERNARLPAGPVGGPPSA